MKLQGFNTITTTMCSLVNTNVCVTESRTQRHTCLCFFTVRTLIGPLTPHTGIRQRGHTHTCTGAEHTRLVYSEMLRVCCLHTQLCDDDSSRDQYIHNNNDSVWVCVVTTTRTFTWTTKQTFESVRTGPHKDGIYTTTERPVHTDTHHSVIVSCAGWLTVNIYSTQMRELMFCSPHLINLILSCRILE